MSKLAAWLRLQHKSEHLSIAVFIIFTWLLCFIRPIMGDAYTAWDTHDLGFVNFLYFSDSLRDGVIPFWNHFIQSGTFLPSLFNVGLFSPFQLFFVGLSWFFNPAYVYEIMLQSIIFVGGGGAFLLFYTVSKDKLIALFGAISFAVSVLVPITGQVMFLFSLSSFPWLIYLCVKTIKSKKKYSIRYVCIGALGAMYISSGYVWMNLVNIIITFLFLIFIAMKAYLNAETLDKEYLAPNLIKLGLFLSAYGFLYISLMLPGYLNLSDLYSAFSGDYINPEPRLRSLGVQPHYSYNSFQHALVGSIDPRIAINNDSFFSNLPKWSFGAGWVIWIIALGVSTKKFLSWQVFWGGVLFLALLYSYGDSNFIGNWVEKIPLLNANRWWFIGGFYLTIAIIFLSIPKLMKLSYKKGSEKLDYLQLIFVSTAAISFLVYFESSIFEFVLVLSILLSVFLLMKVREEALWKNIFFLLIGVNVCAIAYMPYSLPNDNQYFTSKNGYTQQINNREKSVIITENTRQLAEVKEYIYNDERWLLEKIPSSHGFNPLGNPWHWYWKNEPFLSSFVIVTQKVRKALNLNREDFSSDNAFAQAIASDVLTDSNIPTIDHVNYHKIAVVEGFDWKLNELRIEPNLATMTVSLNSNAYLIFNNANSSDWSAYVDGEKVNIVSTNHIYQGIFLKDAGTHEVVFKYQPKVTVFLILCPYIVLILCFVAYLVRRIKRGWLIDKF